MNRNFLYELNIKNLIKEKTISIKKIIKKQKWWTLRLFV